MLISRRLASGTSTLGAAILTVGAARSIRGDLPQPTLELVERALTYAGSLAVALLLVLGLLVCFRTWWFRTVRDRWPIGMLARFLLVTAAVPVAIALDAVIADAFGRVPTTAFILAGAAMLAASSAFATFAGSRVRDLVCRLRHPSGHPSTRALHRRTGPRPDAPILTEWTCDRRSCSPPPTPVT